MYIGTELWKDRISVSLIRRKLRDGREIETFPGLTESLYGAVADSAQKYPEKPAIEDDLGRKLSYRELLAEVDRFAACLKHRFGLKRNDHAALMVYGCAEFCIAFLALQKLGVVAVMLPTKYRKPEIRALAEQSDLKCIICDADFADWFEPELKQGVSQIICDPGTEEISFHKLERSEDPIEEAEGLYEDLAVMMFTSGTTSQSKSVMLTNYNFLHAAGVYSACFHLTENDKTVIPVPTYMITGLSGLLGTFLYIGGTVYLYRFFNAERVLSCVKEHEITFMHAAPTVYNLLLSERDKFPELPSLRCLACGGSRTPEEKIRQFHDWLPDCTFHTVYGMTETTSPGTILPEAAYGSRNCLSNGIPVPGLCYKVLDEEGQELPQGEIGELAVSGSNITVGYYKLDTPLYQNGWLRTGDIGYFNEEGYCYVLDRKKDMINRGGEKVVSMDVENELLKIRGVADAAVVGIPDPVYGDTPVALIRKTSESGITEEIIRSELYGRIAKYKIPSRFLFTDQIPLTPNGKVDKKYIRTLFMEGE